MIESLELERTEPSVPMQGHPDFYLRSPVCGVSLFSVHLLVMVLQNENKRK